MIPKIINYVWLGEQKPVKIQNYIDNWHNKLSDYKIIEWNERNFDINSITYVKLAVEHKKFAFASDYIRLWALYNHGGIYLDADVECLKSFDDLLHLPYFLGQELTKGIIGMATLGAEPKCKWIKDCLDYYENKNFTIPSGKFSMEPIPCIMLRILSKKYGLKRIESVQNFDKNSKEIQILPTDFFSPKSWDSEKFIVTKNTYAIHYFEKSWNPPKRRFAKLFRAAKYLVKKIIGEKRYLNILWRIYAN